jgi:hypothetical protein
VKVCAMLAIIALARVADNPRSWISTQRSASYRIRSLGFDFDGGGWVGSCRRSVAALVGAGKEWVSRRSASHCSSALRPVANGVSRLAAITVECDDAVLHRRPLRDFEIEISWRASLPSSRRRLIAAPRRVDPSFYFQVQRGSGRKRATPLTSGPKFGAR